MAAQILFDGGGNVVFDCDGNIVFCDTEADNYLCCSSCVSVADGDEVHYNLLVPCGPINLNVTGITSPMGGCTECDHLNDDFEIGFSDPSCATWSEDFPDYLDQFGDVGCSLIDLTVDLEILVCCDDDNDEVVLYADFLYTYGATGYNAYRELDRRALVDGECHFFDLSAVFDGAGISFTCSNGDDVGSCNNAPTACTHTNCDLTNATWTFTR